MSNDMQTTYDESGKALTESVDGITMPAELTFDCVNEFVHSHNVIFEELQWLCLGLATELENASKKTRASVWVSVEDRLPEPETPVLGLVDGYDGVLTLERRWELCNPMIESYFEDFLYWDWVDNDGQDLEGRVTHWQPLPEPPAEDEA